MTNKTKNALTVFICSSVAYISAVSWVVYDSELDMESRAFIAILYFMIVGTATAMTYDFTENKKP